MGSLDGLPLSNLRLCVLRKWTWNAGPGKDSWIYIDQARAQRGEISLGPPWLRVLKSGLKLASTVLNMNPKQAARELAAKSKRQTSFLNRGG